MSPIPENRVALSTKMEASRLFWFELEHYTVRLTCKSAPTVIYMYSQTVLQYIKHSDRTVVTPSSTVVTGETTNGIHF